ncbi:hypothetical protein PISMIDRAFT_683478, partial [Pisolithus microcarpus 441]
NLTLQIGLGAMARKISYLRWPAGSEQGGGIVESTPLVGGSNGYHWKLPGTST